MHKTIFAPVRIPAPAGGGGGLRPGGIGVPAVGGIAPILPGPSRERPTWPHLRPIPTP